VGNNPVNEIDPEGLREVASEASAGINILKLFGQILDTTRNPATKKYGLTAQAVLIDTSIANVKITTGTVISAVGLGIAVGTILEDVGTGGVGIIDDPVTLTGSAATIAFGITLSKHGIQDLIDLGKNYKNRR